MYFAYTCVNNGLRRKVELRWFRQLTVTQTTSFVHVSRNSGITRVDVSRSGNCRCRPYFFLKKTDDLFSHQRLPVLRCHPYLPEKLTTFLFFSSSLSLLLISLGCHPLKGVTPHLFYLFDLVCPLFFVNLLTIFFVRVWVSPPGWCVTRGGLPPPCPSSDATVQEQYCTKLASVLQKKKLSLSFPDSGTCYTSYTLLLK